MSRATPVRPWRRAPISSPGRIAPGGGDGYTEPRFVREREEREAKPFVPIFPPTATYRWCRSGWCRRRYKVTGDEHPICCPRCRKVLRLEAIVNDVDSELPEEQLIDVIAAIAAIDRELLLISFVADQAKRAGQTGEARRIRRRGVRRSVDKAVLIAEANGR